MLFVRVLCKEYHVKPQADQTLFVIYIRDSIALRFEPFKRMYENDLKIALNSTCCAEFKLKRLTLVCACVI